MKLNIGNISNYIHDELYQIVHRDSKSTNITFGGYHLVPRKDGIEIVDPINVTVMTKEDNPREYARYK